MQTQGFRRTTTKAFPVLLSKPAHVYKTMFKGNFCNATTMVASKFSVHSLQSLLTNEKLRSYRFPFF